MNPNSENPNETKMEQTDEKSMPVEQIPKDESPEYKPGDVFYVPEERQVKKKDSKKRGIKSPKVFIPIIAIVVIIVVVLVIVLGNSSSSSSSEAVLQSVRSVSSATSAANRYSGVIETQKSESVAFDTTQKLDQLYVAEGDTVKKGDKLFSYNTDSINLSIQKLQVENEISQNSINSNNSQISQYQSLMSNASASEVITYTAQIQELQATNAQLEYNIKTKTAEIAVKQKSLENATVTAPIDGTIKKIADLSGSSDSDSGSSADASAYITITASGNLRVKGSVGEQNIAEIMAGVSVIIRSRVDTSQTWKGTVTSVVTQSTTESTDSTSYYSSSSGESSTKYPFYVDLESTEGLILGQHVTIEVDYGQDEEKEGIWLNSAWLTFEGDNAYVLAARTASGPAEKRQVTLGEYDVDLDEYEIIDGLTEAEYIALPESSVSENYDYSEDIYMEDSDYSYDSDYSEDIYIEDSDYSYDSDSTEDAASEVQYDSDSENLSQDIVTSEANSGNGSENE